MFRAFLVNLYPNSITFGLMFNSARKENPLFWIVFMDRFTSEKGFVVITRENEQCLPIHEFVVYFVSFTLKKH